MQAFRSGFERVEASINAWTDAGRTFRAGLVASIGATPNPDWQNLSDFIGSNPLIADADTPSMPTRTVETWNGVQKRVNFRWTNRLSFGTPAAAQQFVGVVTYEDSGTPSTSPLWFFDDGGSGFPGQTQGGLTRWGLDGTANVAGYLEAVTGSVTPLAGASYDFREIAGAWQSAASFKLRLVSDAGVSNPNVDWVTLQDMFDSGVIFATGAPDVTISQGMRSAGYQIFDFNGDSFEFVANPGTPYTFTSVPSGQTVIAVLMFRDTGSPTTSKVWHWDGAFAPAVMTGGDFIYGNGITELIQKVQL